MAGNALGLIHPLGRTGLISVSLPNCRSSAFSVSSVSSAVILLAVFWRICRDQSSAGAPQVPRGELRGAGQK